MGAIEKEWVALYLNTPHRREPGTYCARCGHSDEPYTTTFCLKVGCRDLHIECGNRRCGCDTHMAESFVVAEGE